MQKVVGIKFSSNKIYYFDPGKEIYEVGNEVVVETANGTVIGMVLQAERDISKSEIEEPLRPVLRLASDRDKKRQAEMRQKAQEILPSIEEKVSKLGLKMKIVDAEYTLDGGKVVITFTAEGRVDFRDLLKELASSLKVRIELRQIGTRDEVRAVGGMGLCGMECCCTRFQNEPDHVSVKMAKLQGLSLSPNKINGLCGKLMCCLTYENPTYVEILSKMPKVGSQIKTPDGIGIVQYNNVLKELVTVKIEGKDESFQINEYPIDKVEKLNNPNQQINKKK